MDSEQPVSRWIRRIVGYSITIFRDPFVILVSNEELDSIAVTAGH